MVKIAKRIWNIMTGMLVAVVIVLAILLIGVRLVGIMPYTVLSGSMEPEYHVGSMIYVVSVDPTSLDVRDPVTFYLDSTTVATHRVIEVIDDDKNPGAKYYRTQGDANDDPDSELLHSSKVIGKPIFTIPYLGFLSNYIQHDPGRTITLIVCLVLMVLTFVPDLLFREKKENSEQTTDEV